MAGETGSQRVRAVVKVTQLRAAGRTEAGCPSLHARLLPGSHMRRHPVPSAGRTPHGGTVFPLQRLAECCAMDGWAGRTVCPSWPQHWTRRLPECEENSVCHWNKTLPQSRRTTTRGESPCVRVESKLPHVAPGAVMLSNGLVNLIPP